MSLEMVTNKVYGSKERKLNLIGKYKSTDDQRILLPYGSAEANIQDSLIGLVDESDEAAVFNITNTEEKTVIFGYGPITIRDNEVHQINNGQLNELFDIPKSIRWKMEKQDNGSFNLATNDPSYRICLARVVHSSPDHSCIYVNNKQGTVVTSCFSHRGGRIDKAREKRILNFFESIVLKRSSKETKKKPFVELVEHMEDCAFENGYLRVQGTGEVYKRTNGLNYAYEKFKDAIDFINYLFMDDSLFLSCNNAMDRLKKWIMNDASSKFKFLQTDKSFIGRIEYRILRTHRSQECSFFYCSSKVL